MQRAAGYTCAMTCLLIPHIERCQRDASEQRHPPSHPGADHIKTLVLLLVILLRLAGGGCWGGASGCPTRRATSSIAATTASTNGSIWGMCVCWARQARKGKAGWRRELCGRGRPHGCHQPLPASALCMHHASPCAHAHTVNPSPQLHPPTCKEGQHPCAQSRLLSP